MTSAPSVALLSHLASPAAPTGAEFSLAILAEGLARRGWRVDVVIPGRWPLAPRVEAAGATVHPVPCRSCWLAYHDPRPFPIAALKWLRFALPDRGAEALRGLLTRLRPDVALVNCLPHLRGAAAARAAGIPVVWYVREILPGGRRRRFFAGHLRRSARRIAAVSEATALWLRAESLGDRVEVIPNGVAVPAAPPDAASARRILGLPLEGCLVGLFGQLLPHKGAELFLRAAATALEQAPSLRFVLAGRGPERYIARLRRDRAGRPGADRFHWLPPQESGDRLVAAADVVCLTTTAPDPLPRVVLEAMAASRPVAVFRSGGAGEMVRHNETGLVSEVGDTSRLASDLVRLARDPALRRTLGEAGAARARSEFSIDRHLDRVERLLRTAAA